MNTSTANTAGPELKNRFLTLVTNTAEKIEPPPSDETVNARIESSAEAAVSNEPGRGAERLIPLIEGFPLYLDESTATSFFWIHGKLQEINPKNRELVEDLSFLYRNITGKVLGKDAAVGTITYYSAKARQQGEKLELFNRIGERNGKFYTALGNGRTMEIEPGICRVIDDPVMFRQTGQQRPQPQPNLSDNPDPFRLFDFLAVAPEDKLLLMVYVILAFVPRIFKPALQVIGPQGAGKSVLCSMLKMLVDPTAVVLSSMPRKPEDLDLLLWKYYVTVLDNLSGLTNEVCDRLCAFVTGGVIEKRQLHTDTDTIILRTNAIVILNGIVALHDRPDLSERTWRIAVERISKEKRTTEKRLWNAFETALPEILGGCFVTLAKAMEIYPKIEGTLSGLPRMADAAEWGYAIAEALSPGKGAEFLLDVTGNSSQQTADLLETNTFFGAIIAAMERPGPGEFSGGFGDILSELREIAAPGGVGLKSLEKDRSFPTAARSFRRHLERLKIPLEDMAIGYTYTGATNKHKAGVAFYKRTDANMEKPAPAAVEDIIFEDGEIF